MPVIRRPGSITKLTAITAAIIGGTNLFGGRGSILGTMIGALIMGVLQNGLNLLAVQAYYQQMAIGAVLILAVWIDQLQIPPDDAAMTILEIEQATKILRPPLMSSRVSISRSRPAKLLASSVTMGPANQR